MDILDENWHNIGIDHADNEKQSFIAAVLSKRYRTVNLLQKYAEDGPAISGFPPTVNL